MTETALITAVGPRDGLQTARGPMGTARTPAWIDALHDTGGFGLANACAAFEEGVRAFESSLAGLGDCPCAPEATGNIVTEDLVNLFEQMGIATGVSLDGLLHAGALLAARLPDEPLHGHVRPGACAA